MNLFHRKYFELSQTVDFLRGLPSTVQRLMQGRTGLLSFSSLLQADPPKNGPCILKLSIVVGFSLRLLEIFFAE